MRLTSRNGVIYYTSDAYVVYENETKFRAGFGSSAHTYAHLYSRYCGNEHLPFCTL